MLENLTDEDLMVMYQNGAENAFQVLYLRHSSKVYGFLKRRIWQKEKVNEIYQEVFVKVHRSKHLYNSNFPFLPWIFTITRSVMIDEFRKDKKFKLFDDVDMEKIPDLQTASSSANDPIEMMKDLPEPQKVAIQMRYIDEKTFEEIAQILNTSPANVRQIVSRGLKRLKQLMTQGGQS